MIRGTTIYLTRFDETNAEQARAWLNDPEVNEWMLSGQLPISRAQEASFHELTERQWNDSTAYRFEVHAAEDGRLLGIVGLDSVSMLHRRGEVGIFIGSLTDQNRGYGRDALLTLLRFGFDRLGLNSIAIKANAENERAVHLYSSIGFLETGRERECVFMRGRFRDHICYDMLASEFHERYGLSE